MNEPLGVDGLTTQISILCSLYPKLLIVRDKKNTLKGVFFDFGRTSLCLQF